MMSNITHCTYFLDYVHHYSLYQQNSFIILTINYTFKVQIE